MTDAHMTLENIKGSERFMWTQVTAPFYPVDLQFMIEPGMAVCKHPQIALLEGANIGFKVA